MAELDLPLILEPDILESCLGSADLLVVDLGKAETYAQLHVPGAVHLDYPHILAADHPAMGLLPDAATLAGVLGNLGITSQTHVVAYDDEGGGRAARLLWTLDAVGHRHASLLNGGIHAWANERHPLDHTPVRPVPASPYPVTGPGDAVVDRDYVRAHLGDGDVCLLDTRSSDEYRGTRILAARGGHIPGAVNLEWTAAMDPSRNMRLRPAPELQALLHDLGVTPDREVITYCHTHHRSAHTYVVLKSLGYPRVRGYPGSWSDWGNRSDTPVE